MPSLRYSVNGNQGKSGSKVITPNRLVYGQARGLARKHADCLKHGNHYHPPKAASEISTAAPFALKIAFIFPRVTGSTEYMKNSALFIWPS